jgi:predicted ester cyclase
MNTIAASTATGTQKGDFNGAPASGKSFSIEVIDILRLANGKVIEHWGISDDAAMMRQLGITPPPAK